MIEKVRIIENKESQDEGVFLSYLEGEYWRDENIEIGGPRGTHPHPQGPGEIAPVHSPASRIYIWYRSWSSS